MADTLVVKYTKCPHDNWHSHNSIYYDDGTFEMTDQCSGGTAEVNGQVWGISHFTATTLREMEGDDG